ncbi:MAG TPA: hypothetical protein VFY73_18380 [Ideonella sp.]|uniref:hypothetical protein n=1 Tax=Ideonella sp. TaxID=1929293 RepID=UPI002E37EBEE|nr:hypothetical protein [Ideonella sp.]HEX5685997.1 hypothetical protein [Ideonella sp.]
MNTSQSIALIRHAEKPTDNGVLRGVDETGREDQDDLSVRGWQRAGALALFFWDHRRAHADQERPCHLLAPEPSRAHPSRRGISTLLPLAGHCGVGIATPYPVGGEQSLARYLKTLSGFSVVAWEHKRLPALAAQIVGPDVALPASWPDDRFDLVWLLAADGKGRWRFMQLPQLLLGGDSPTVLALAPATDLAQAV